MRTWESDCTPGVSAYLLENGHLLRPGAHQPAPSGFGPGAGGRVQEFDGDGQLLWDFTVRQREASAAPRRHQAAQRQRADDRVGEEDERGGHRRRAPAGPGGQRGHPSRLLDRGEADRQDHRRDRLGMAPLGPPGPGPRPVEAQLRQRVRPPRARRPQLWCRRGPDRPDDGHQGRRRQAAIARLPRRHAGARCQGCAQAASRKKNQGPSRRKSPNPRPKPKSGPNQGRPNTNADWTHFNAVAYNPDLDQIVVSVHAFSEFWIIDHSTTTAEAASHKGGRSGKGGDLLYRWGNPRAYRNGSKIDQRLFSQHNAHWIPPGLPGEGHMLVFNNGSGRPGGDSSSVDEIVLPVDSQGQYTRDRRGPYGPTQAVWSYSAPKKSDFYSFFISGRTAASQRQYADLLGSQRHGLRGDAGQGGGLEVREPRHGESGRSRRPGGSPGQRRSLAPCSCAASSTCRPSRASRSTTSRRSSATSSTRR